MSSDILIGDLETNSLRPSVIWMAGILDYNSGKFTSYHGDAVAEGLMRLAEADCVIGHNFLDYDAKVIKNLTQGLVEIDPERIVDTMTLGRRCQRKGLIKLPNHKLTTYGDLLGIPKLPFKEFNRFSPEMIPYCQRDCDITRGAFDYLMNLLG